MTIANVGDQLLVIDQVRSSCVCAGLELKSQGAYAPIHTIEIKPKQKMEVFARLRAVGRPGAAVLHDVIFRTNDPQKPEARIRLKIHKVLGGLLPMPASVTFPPLRLEQSVPEQSLELWDYSGLQRSIASIALEPEGCFSMQAVTPKEISDSALRDQGKCLGAWSVRFLAKNVGVYRGVVRIKLVGASADLEVPLQAEILPAVELIPDQVNLPKRTSQGLSYATKVICRTSEAAKISVAPLPGWQVDVKAIGKEDNRFQIQLEFIDKAALTHAIRHTLPIHVRMHSGREEVVQLAIELVPPTP